jgi:hypothetical protein
MSTIINIFGAALFYAFSLLPGVFVVVLIALLTNKKKDVIKELRVQDLFTSIPISLSYFVVSVLFLILIGHLTFINFALLSCLCSSLLVVAIILFCRKRNKTFLWKKLDLKNFFLKFVKGNFVLLAIIILFTYLARLPHKFLSGADEATYTSQIQYIFEEGGFAIKHDLIDDSLSDDIKSSLLPLPYKLSENEGYIVNQWPKGYPILGSIYYNLNRGFDSIDAIFMVNFSLALFLLIYIYISLQNVLSRSSRFFVTTLFCLDWLFLWFARYPMAEMTVTFFSVISLIHLMLFIYYKEKKYFWYFVLSSLALPVTKVEGIIAVSIFVVVLVIYSLYYKTYKDLLSKVVPYIVALISIFMLYLAVDEGFRKYYFMENVKIDKIYEKIKSN